MDSGVSRATSTNLRRSFGFHIFSPFNFESQPTGLSLEVTKKAGKEIPSGEEWNFTLKVLRARDDKVLNLRWSTFSTPVSQRVVGNYSSITETAHPIRIDADSINPNQELRKRKGVEKQRKRVENVSMWQTNLITLYCAVCDNSSTIEAVIQRQSNNFRPQFSNEECITVYLWGISQRRFEQKTIYNYTKNHLLD